MRIFAFRARVVSEPVKLPSSCCCTKPMVAMGRFSSFTGGTVPPRRGARPALARKPAVARRAAT